jgi:hypothetical protein
MGSIVMTKDEIQSIIDDFCFKLETNSFPRPMLNRLNNLPEDCLRIIWCNVFNDSIKHLPKHTKDFFQNKMNKAEREYKDMNRQADQYYYGGKRIKTQKGSDRWNNKMKELFTKQENSLDYYLTLRNFYKMEIKPVN